MKNHLHQATSPYLLQHADNPVNWYPWGTEAFTRAREEDKPIFLSVGYSTCHWCHVMAHESFEDDATAKILNKYFISIKVDREERPDIDSVYMSVCQALTGSGGWPMSIFMTWEKQPFFAGTYFPPQPRYGMPGFTDLLESIALQWRSNRSALLQSADQIVSHLSSADNRPHSMADNDLARRAVALFSDSFDDVNGGFGTAPKFPTPHNLLFLTYYSIQKQYKPALDMVEKTLTQMRSGGIFDQVGGGFSRYSTDNYYLVPHFEKMLYDNALLIMAYTAVYCVTDKKWYLDTAIETATYILREMTAPCGGFYSAQDADSEGIEGKFYTFTLNEIIDQLGEEQGSRFAKAYDITAMGNFEGTNIPNLLKHKNISAAIEEDFREELDKLYQYRKRRAQLHLDDKILTAWNALMSAAFSMLYRACGNDAYLEAARASLTFIEKNLCEGTHVYTSWRNGKHSDTGFLDDYAFYIIALIELYSSTLDKSYLKRAEALCMEAETRFADKDNGGYFLCETASRELFFNPKETYDGAMPSGNSAIAYILVRLHHLTGKEIYDTLARRQLSYLAGQAQGYPAGHCLFLLAKLMQDDPPIHITIVPKDGLSLPKSYRLPLLADLTVETDSKAYPLRNDKTTYYVCKGHTCCPPTNQLPLQLAKHCDDGSGVPGF